GVGFTGAAGTCRRASATMVRIQRAERRRDVAVQYAAQAVPAVRVPRAVRNLRRVRCIQVKHAAGVGAVKKPKTECGHRKRGNESLISKLETRYLVSYEAFCRGLLETRSRRGALR